MNLGARRAVSLAGMILPFLYFVGIVSADEPGLQVDYDPPQLSVEAREVSLGAVLRAIGAKVGFSVVETVPSSRVVTLSIRNASLDDVLRQLLRARNHTMIYRVEGPPSAESGPVDRIVLFGDSVTVTAAATPSGPSSRNAPQAPDHDNAGARTAPVSLPTSPQSWPESTSFMNPAPVDPSDPAAPISVGEMLRSHAMAAVQGSQLAGNGANSPAPPPPANVHEALAETTRRAQQSLGALIDGLAAATRSLQQSLPPGRQ